MSERSTDFSIKRIDAFAHCVRLCGVGALWYHRVVVEGGHNLPREGPGLLLPKHHAYRDIVVEGVLLHRITRRYATYVMKRGLWGIIEYFGGLKVVRPKDIRRIADREQRRAEIRRARVANQQMQDYLDELYRHGELVISHPEGMRYQDELGPLRKEVIEHLVKAEERLGVRVPLIPIGLEYASYARPRSPVYFRVDEPLYADSFADVGALMNHLDGRLRVLSGLT
ncbi:MAG: 1-acyl-sn-glycerol-3-phosphate acyltransferase [Candidatus Latescibacterota bacterium]|nr:1-acyl-sn-glycerol-3-phosphate acyltransferase [Candidatus Latescibacterota bacterium]